MSADFRNGMTQKIYLRLMNVAIPYDSFTTELFLELNFDMMPFVVEPIEFFFIVFNYV